MIILIISDEKFECLPLRTIFPTTESTKEIHCSKMNYYNICCNHLHVNDKNL